MAKVQTKKEKKDAATEAKLKKNEIITQQRSELSELEQFFANGTVNDIDTKLEVIKQEKVNQMIEYAKQHEKDIYNLKTGDVIGTRVDMNPLVVNNLFFKTICPIGCKVPVYTPEKLSLIYDYYLYLLTEVNDKIGNFPSSLASFCKLAGITTRDLRTYRNSPDIDMRNIAEKIYDEIGDNNLSMAQLGIVKGTPTQFKLKTQNEMVEKSVPNVNITYKEVVNVDKMNKNIEKYRAMLGDK